MYLWITFKPTLSVYSFYCGFLKFNHWSWRALEKEILWVILDLQQRSTFLEWLLIIQWSEKHSDCVTVILQRPPRTTKPLLWVDLIYEVKISFRPLLGRKVPQESFICTSPKHISHSGCKNALSHVRKNSFNL